MRFVLAPALLAAAALAWPASLTARSAARHPPLTPPTVSNAPLLLVPPIEGGSRGWCMALSSANGCGGIAHPGGPIVAEDWAGEAYRADGKEQGQIVGYALTLPTVAAVSIEGGPPIPTRPESFLPDGLRAVAVEYQLPPGSFQTTELPDRFTPLAASGQPLPQPDADALLIEGSPSLDWQRPQRERHGPCQLTAPHLPDTRVEWGTVLVAIQGYQNPWGRPYLSCISKEFFISGWPLLAAVLLDGAQPGVTPAALPAMRATAGHPGVYAAYSADGAIDARRIPRAWLVVQGGRDLRQRLALLAHLRATIHLPHG